MDETTARTVALDQAVQWARKGDVEYDADSIVEVAQKFYGFLVGGARSKANGAAEG